jgi:hypothetical protein
MKTDKQISNAQTRAARLADEAARKDQTTHLAATPEQMSSERGSAMNAASFAAAALGHLENGNYTRFLTCMRLAASFTRDADEAHGSREIAR